MKKSMPVIFLMILFVAAWGCQQKDEPTAPGDNDSPVLTQTATATPSSTADDALTEVPSITATVETAETATMTPNNTLTMVTSSITPTFSAEITVTVTKTKIPEDTKTPTPENTFIFTETNTPTGTGTATNTQTGTVTITNTPTGTGTATNTQTSTVTITNTPTSTGTATNTPAGTVTATATQTADAGLSYTSFVSIPGGTFTQTDGSESFSHTISSFFIGKYEVTYELWYEVRQWALSNGYAFANAGREGNDGTDGAEPTGAKYEPVTYINWRDVIVWCNAYSQMAGLTPVYCSDAGFTTPIKDSTDGAYGSSINTAQGSYDNPYVNWDCDGYRLPTEGEWEYAARYINGSSWTPYNYASGDTAPYNTSTTIGDYCWYGENSGNVTHDVGGKTANALGIYDMSGNMYEWCWDWDADYPGASTNYRGPASGSLRMLRGGGYRYIAEYLQTGYRNFTGSPFVEADVLGFRLARTQ